ncbi:UNVERIFIED_CONTAM: hypothetical protein HDU68_004122 [Siphonaria sp. JEL0065]|nr:hypothetical protein HDU68_004122 [Siphonaria sp. JEL0065]
MQQLQRVALPTTALFGLTTAAYFKYTAPVRTVIRLDETPASFQTAFKELKVSNLKRTTTWGFYTRSYEDVTGSYCNTDGAIVENAVEAKQALNILTRKVFSSKWYWLEVVLSGAKEDALKVEGRVGERFGNMLCVSRSPNEALWRYDHPDFDFAMFLGAYDSTQVIGFIELNGDEFEDGGSRVLLPLLLEDAARKTVI